MGTPDSVRLARAQALLEEQAAELKRLRADARKPHVDPAAEALRAEVLKLRAENRDLQRKRDEPLHIAWPPEGYKPETVKPAKASKADTLRIAVIPDKHVPSHDRRACATARGVIREYKPHRVQIIGDFMDMESLTHFPKRKPDITRLSAEYYEANVELDADQSAAPDAIW